MEYKSKLKEYGKLFAASTGMAIDFWGWLYESAYVEAKYSVRNLDEIKKHSPEYIPKTIGGAASLSINKIDSSEHGKTLSLAAGYVGGLSLVAISLPTLPIWLLTATADGVYNSVRLARKVYKEHKEKASTLEEVVGG